MVLKLRADGAIEPAYAYMKDPDEQKHWMLDREAADVVYEIGLYVVDEF